MVSVTKEKSSIGISEDESIGEVSSYDEKKGFFTKLLRKIEVDTPNSLTKAQTFLVNQDLKPVEEARRLWSWYNYVFFWVADSFNIRYV